MLCLADGIPAAQRVTLSEVKTAISSSGQALMLTFSIKYEDLVKSVSVDVEEQDNNFMPIHTRNYTLTEDVYKTGSVCVGSLTPEIHYVVCLRVDYSDIGHDTSCRRLSADDNPDETTTDQCQPPNSSRRVAGSGESSGTNTSKKLLYYHPSLHNIHLFFLF